MLACEQWSPIIKVKSFSSWIMEVTLDYARAFISDALDPKVKKLIDNLLRSSTIVVDVCEGWKSWRSPISYKFIL